MNSCAMSGALGFAIRAEDQPAWAEIVRRAERGESVAVIAHGDHVADVVPQPAELGRGQAGRRRMAIKAAAASTLAASTST